MRLKIIVIDTKILLPTVLQYDGGCNPSLKKQNDVYDFMIFWMLAKSNNMCVFPFFRMHRTEEVE